MSMHKSMHMQVTIMYQHCIQLCMCVNICLCVRACIYEYTCMQHVCACRCDGRHNTIMHDMQTWACMQALDWLTICTESWYLPKARTHTHAYTGMYVCMYAIYTLYLCMYLHVSCMYVYVPTNVSMYVCMSYHVHHANMYHLCVWSVYVLCMNDRRCLSGCAWVCWYVGIETCLESLRIDVRMPDLMYLADAYVCMHVAGCAWVR